MKETESEDTAHLLDAEPPLFLGCSASDFTTLAGAGFAMGTVLGIIAWILSGIWLLILPCMLVMPMIVIFVGGKKLGKAKEGKPEGYYERMLAVTLKRFGLNKDLVTHVGYWRNRR
jgi:conjugative transfer region protein (TIGR03750 family)